MMVWWIVVRKVFGMLKVQSTLNLMVFRHNSGHSFYFGNEFP